MTIVFILGASLLIGLILPAIESVLPQVQPEVQNLDYQPNPLLLLALSAIFIALIVWARRLRQGRPIENKVAGERIPVRAVYWTPILVPDGGSSGRGNAYLGIRIDNNGDDLYAKLVSLSHSVDGLAWDVMDLDEVNPTDEKLGTATFASKKIFRVAEEFYDDAYITFSGKKSLDLAPGIYELQLEIYDHVQGSQKTRVLERIKIRLLVAEDPDQMWVDRPRKRVEWVKNKS